MAEQKAATRELLSPEQKHRIRTDLLAWYRRGHRDLPWRRMADPYAIWISEIMLQQTRVETVKEYFRRFMLRFPTISSLAGADLDQVLTLWSGLGYYARARNLHTAAREIVAQYGGTFPMDPQAVRGLRGIGPYTAGAILSISFGQRAALVDGNVIRVLSRLFALSDPLEATATRKRHWQLAEELVPEARETGPKNDRSIGTANDPGDFNQALMELGATVCLPQGPTCLLCPLSDVCQGRKSGDPEVYPAKKRERQVPRVEVVTLVLSHRGRILLCRRPPLGLWGGLWEPPTGERQAGEADPMALSRLCTERLGLVPASLLRAPQPLTPFDHVLTHRHMRFTPYLVSLRAARRPEPRLDGGYDEARWIDPAAPAAIGLSAWVTSLLASLRPETGHNERI